EAIEHELAQYRAAAQRRVLVVDVEVARIGLRLGGRQQLAADGAVSAGQNLDVGRARRRKPDADRTGRLGVAMEQQQGRDGGQSGSYSAVITRAGGSPERSSA